MIEEWKDITEYEGLYQVSNLGNVRSINNGKLKLLKNVIGSSGYYQVTLSNKGNQKQKRVHQLVAAAFLNHQPNGYNLVVNHKDLNKLNNNINNLEIVTNRKNTSLKHLKVSSKYTGVCKHKKSNKWVAFIRINNSRKYLGLFEKEIDAHLAYQNELNKI